MHASRPGLLALLAYLVLVPYPRLGANTVAPERDPGVDVTLPVYEIAETREPAKRERWLHGQVAGFEVLSCGTESQTTKLVEELQRFRIALGAVWPQALRHGGPPVTLILCGRGDTFDAFAPFNPENSRTNSSAASRFLADKERAYLIVDLTRRSLQLVDDENFRRSGDTLGTEDITIDHYQELIRAYIRYLVRRPTPPPPPWLAEGLTQLISAVKYDRGSITFGELEAGVTSREGLQATSRGSVPYDLDAASRTRGQAELVPGDPDAPPGPAGVARAGNARDFTGVRGGMILMPMEQFFAVEENSPAANLTLGTNWADQAHAFVHLCIYGENHRFQKPFFTFIARLQNEPLTEALFVECFKMNYKKFGGFLRRYTASAWHTAERFDLERGKLPEPEPLVLEEAPFAREARIRGNALLIARGEDTAFRTLVEPYREGDRDPELLASLGIVEARLGHTDNALRLLETATRDNVQRPRAYTELARLRLAAFRKGTEPPASAIPLGKAQLAQVLRPLFAARQIRPAVPELYALIAEAWAHSATAPTVEHLAVLMEGAALFPSESATLLLAAQLHQKIGALREAAALADLGATWATDRGMKEQLLALKASLPEEAQVDLAGSAAHPSGGKAAAGIPKSP